MDIFFLLPFLLINAFFLFFETTSDGDLTSHLNLDNYLCMKYSPVTSVDVERPFTMYKNILSSKPQRSRRQLIMVHGSEFFF